MSSNKENFYEILGVNENAGEHEIKKAYRALSLKYHPDRNPSPDAMDKIQMINEAYETLGDPGKRRQYDMFLRSGGMNMGGMGGMGGMNMGGMGDDMGLNEFFNMVFGGGQMGGPGVHVFPGGGAGAGAGAGTGNPFEQMFHGGGPDMFNRMQKPVPIMKTVTITLEQCYTGASIPVEIERWFYINGSKTVEKETIYITVPPGLDDNEMLIMADRGNVLSDFCRGDVKINFQINNTTPFVRQGLDLIYRKKITLKEALCGFTFDIQHLNGKSIHVNNLTNRSIIKPNMKRVIPSLGMNRETNTGNLIIEFDIEFPETISETNLQIIGDLL